MKQDDYQKKINAYLENKMSPPKRRGFEAELRRDRDLQKKFFRETFQVPALPSPDERRLRDIAARVRNQAGPLAEPSFTWWDKLRFAWHDLASGWKWLGLVALAASAGLFIWANINLKPTDELIRKYFMEAYCPGVAGAENTRTADEIFNLSSGFYCGNQPGSVDSLRTIAASCPDFCMAHYYLAFWQLKNGRYKQAVDGLEDCLNHRDRVLRNFFTPDGAQLEFNLILARLGDGHDVKATRASLNEFLQRQEEYADTYRSAAALRRDLSHPLRFLMVKQ